MKELASGCRLRLAEERDVPALEVLIPRSARALQVPHYRPEQIEAALGPVFGVDRQLIQDGTYFVVEMSGRIVGAGGWSRRRSLFGGDEGRTREDDMLDPGRDAARVRAFFVHPDQARRGLGRALLEASEEAIVRARFRRIELVATLAGEVLYAACGYRVTERGEIDLVGGLRLPVVWMRKEVG
ncbi:MAG: GNAT family N-acetyltransferase [Verrucomicrobiales bacterium]|nr:GNAT family N-acetyltransferase [Verrucomicrobiales bacterium]